MRKILRGHVINKIFLFTLCLGSSFLFEAHAQVSGTFTIDAGAAASATNFQTFSAAVAFLTTNGVNGAVTFNVQPGSGPYNEQVLINTIAGTSAANTITFNGNGETITCLATDDNQRACIKLNNADYITFNNLVVEPQGINFGEYGYGFHLVNDADHNTIRNCRIRVNHHNDIPEFNEGIVINGNDRNSIDPGASNCDHNLIEGNTISGGSVGITLSSSPAFGDPDRFMSGNRIVNNTISDFWYYGMQLYYNEGTQIDGNEITGGPFIYYSSGIFMSAKNQSVSIINNRIHDFWVDESVTDSEVAGIVIQSESVAGKECLIANNLIYNFSTGGMQMGIACRSNPSSYLNIYNNTLSFDDQASIGTYTYAIFFDADISNVNVKNNIITVTRNTNVENYGFYINNDPIALASEHNVFYIQAAKAPLCAVGFYGGNNINSLSTWRDITKFDLFSTDINPAYTNLAGFDFRPTAGAVDNMAAVIGAVNTDITKANRNATNPDPGCYEFTSTACAGPVTPGSAFVTPDSVMCLGPKISLGLRGNSAGSGQTYTWQTATSATGTYTNATAALGYPLYEITPTTTLYYRVALTCGGVTAYSSPVRVMVTSALNAGTYTINSALPTSGVNFNSFADAARALQCGINGSVIFNVASNNGPYNEQLILPAVATSPAKTITFHGNGATIAFKPGNVDQAVIKLNDADYITIDSLNVELLPSATFGMGIQLINNADHNTIKRCNVTVTKSSTGKFFAGIVINGHASDPGSIVDASLCDSNLVTGNTVTGGYYGITCTSESSITHTVYAFGNSITKNKLLDNCTHGIYIAGQENVLVDSNDISHPSRTIFSTEPFVGIKVENTNMGLTVTRNRIHNLLEKVRSSVVQVEGIVFDEVNTVPTKPSIITNNVIYQFKGNGQQHGIYALLSNYLKIYHNTISLDDTASKPFAGVITRGIALFGAVQPGNIIKDNIITVKRGGLANKFGIYFFAADNITPSDYNNIYVSSNGTGGAYTGFMAGTNYATLADWLVARKDTNSIAMDPVYHDLANGDLTPTKIPFENRGTNVGIAKDIVDVARDVARPDIGAIEFTICRQLTNPVLRADSSGVNAVRFSWPSVQNTTGYRVSRDGINWTIPSSGAMGLTHTISGLKPSDTVGLMVKALGSRVDCPEYVSQRVIDTALADGIYVPNTFTPNGNNRNDVFKVYSNTMRSIRWMVFNQWGEKVFETTDLQGEWDGQYKGKPQPIGVYVFVLSGIRSDGSRVNQKGTFNLVR
ncbi:right-handed parallel beta-helix repeat-containing protein [Longitalea arenae]|uniref:right-handed parallel beta-helix repeat-containing protein n=1 Tax=Longitalea arenae TaxID=2812558 RepID=UPI001967646F|nr:right-handed parallel beta-helix repeat-containing protein [Longitalea arenae]